MDLEIYDSIDNNLRKIPKIKSARDYHLYLASGDRLLDLYLDNISLVFGHKTKGFVKSIKNNLSKGLFNPMPSIYEKKILNLLNSIYPNFKAKIYHDKFELISDFKKKLEIEIPLDFFYSGQDYLDSPSCKILRKKPLDNFFDLKIDDTKTNIIIPTLPLPSDFKVELAFFPKELEKHIDCSFNRVSQFKLFLLSRAVSITLKAKNKEIEANKENKKVDKNLKLGETIKDFSERHYSSFNIGNWNRTSCYIFFQNIDKIQYQKIFEEAISHKILINPYYKAPSVLPSMISKKEKKNLENFLLKVYHNYNI